MAVRVTVFPSSFQFPCFISRYRVASAVYSRRNGFNDRLSRIAARNRENCKHRDTHVTCARYNLGCAWSEPSARMCAVFFRAIRFRGSNGEFSPGRRRVYAAGVISVGGHLRALCREISVGAPIAALFRHFTSPGDTRTAREHGFW
jgi:hypothetical protein